MTVQVAIRARVGGGCGVTEVDRPIRTPHNKGFHAVCIVLPFFFHDVYCVQVASIVCSTTIL